MIYSFYQLLWLYFIYSFLGWCLEVAVSAFSKKHFINRGFVTGPLCPIYGTSAVLFAVFLHELTISPFFLFLGSVFLASGVEYITGALFAKSYKRRLWDYSDKKFNLNGYVCLECSVVWGIGGMLEMYLGNRFILYAVNFIPHGVGVITLISLSVILFLDSVISTLALAGMHVRQKQLNSFSSQIQKASFILENAITARVQKRISKSLIESDYTPASSRTVFAEGCCFYKLVCLFFIGAFLGDITETVFCYATTGIIMSRSSVVYGPFSIVWGLGCALLTAVLYRQKDKSDRHIFFAGTMLGGAYEYICSVFTELVFGTVFWDYSGFAFNLGGRINLLYCFFWGIAAVVWLKLIYPKLSDLIERIPVKYGPLICNVLIVFMAANILISSLALVRYTERNTNPDTLNKNDAVSVFLDTHFHDERIERIYPNAIIVE